MNTYGPTYTNSIYARSSHVLPNAAHITALQVSRPMFLVEDVFARFYHSPMARLSTSTSQEKLLLYFGYTLFNPAQGSQVNSTPTTIYNNHPLHTHNHHHVSITYTSTSHYSPAGHPHTACSVFYRLLLVFPFHFPFFSNISAICLIIYTTHERSLATDVQQQSHLFFPFHL